MCMRVCAWVYERYVLREGEDVRKFERKRVVEKMKSEEKKNEKRGKAKLNNKEKPVDRRQASQTVEQN